MSLVRLRAIWITNHPPSVLWHCWLGHLTCKNIVSEMTETVTSGMLNLAQPKSFDAWTLVFYHRDSLWQRVLKRWWSQWSVQQRDQDAWQRIEKIRHPKVQRNWPLLLTPPASSDVNQILHVGWFPGPVSRSTVLAHLSKSNSRTFQGLSRTIRRIYMDYGELS